MVEYTPLVVRCFSPLRYRVTSKCRLSPSTTTSGIRKEFILLSEWRADRARERERKTVISLFLINNGLFTNPRCAIFSPRVGTWPAGSQLSSHDRYFRFFNSFRVFSCLKTSTRLFLRRDDGEASENKSFSNVTSLFRVFESFKKIWQFERITK